MPLLKELLQSLPDAEIHGDAEQNIAAVNYDSREVQPGSETLTTRRVSWG